jgi:hypothetical protein
MALSWLVLGTAAWRGFFAAAPIIRDTLENHREDWGKLQSIYTTVRLMGGPLAAAYGAQLAVAALVLTVLAVVAWRRPGGRAEMAAMIAGAMLCTPHILDYDLAAVLGRGGCPGRSWWRAWCFCGRWWRGLSRRRGWRWRRCCWGCCFGWW